jgi:hypothetical protein
MPCAEVQLECVRTRVFHAANDFVPAFPFRLHHQRRDHQIFRIALFHFRDFPNIHFGGPVADELDIGEAHHLRAVVLQSAVSRGCVDDRLANRFPDGAAPSGVKRKHDLPARIRRRAGRQPEWVRRFDAAELYAQVSHVAPPVQ